MTEYPDHYPNGPHEDPLHDGPIVNQCDCCGSDVNQESPIFGDLRCEECEVSR
jgi:hypothetical protein